MDGIEAAKALKARNREEITLPNAGVNIEIVALLPYDFMEARGEINIPSGPLLAKSDAAKEQLRKALLDPVTQRRYFNFLLARGVLTPRVIADRDADLADSEIYVNDLGADAEYALLRIIKLSGLGEMAEVVRSFRETEKEEPSDDRRDGEEVRETPA